LTGYLDRLARYARLILLIDSALLFAGITLTSFNLLLLGWTVYAIGHLGAIVAFISIGAFYRRNMDGWAWTGLGVLILGLVLALPQVANIWSSYAQTPTGAVMLMPVETIPIGQICELVIWIGLAWYGLAARGAKALPAGVGLVFVCASIVGLLAFWSPITLITHLWWVPATLVLILGLVATGASLSPVAESAADAASDPSVRRASSKVTA
jgi:hypothetical protein